MAFVGERHRLEGDISAKELQRALWTNPPPVRLMPGVPRKLDAKGRQQIKKDCDEVFPQIIIGTGDCIKDLDFMLDLQITHVINPCEQEEMPDVDVADLQDADESESGEGKDTVTEQPRHGSSMPGPSSPITTPPASESSPLAPTEAPPSYESVFPDGKKPAA